jgi:hypothetical protein
VDPLDELLESMEEASLKSDASAKAGSTVNEQALPSSFWDDPAAVRAQVRELTQLLKIFLKAGKTLRLYNEEHHFFEGFIDDFIARLYLQFETMDSLTFEVTPASINWAGHTIFSNPDQRENLAFKLYRDGVRMLRFIKGCSVEEVKEFVGLLGRDLRRGNQVGDDLSSLFWEADFKSIKLSVAETFIDYTDESAQVLKSMQEELEALRKEFELGPSGLAEMAHYEPRAERLPEAPSTEQDEVDAALDALLEDEGEDTESILSDPQTPYTPKLPLEIFDDDRMQRVYDELQGIDDPYATFEDVGVVIAQVIQEEQDEEELRLLLSRLDDALSPLLSLTSLTPLNSILRRISLLEQSYRTSTVVGKTSLKIFFEKLTQGERLSLMSRTLNTSWHESQTGELFTFVSLQKPENMAELVLFLDRVESAEARSVIVDALLLLSGRQPDIFLSLLDSASPRLVCDALGALARIGDSLTLSRICGTYDRPEGVIREAVLNSLRGFQSPRVQQLMVSAFNDPEVKVRLAALRYVTVYRVRDAIKPINETIRKREFSKKEFEEQRGWFIALGHLAGESILPSFLAQAKEYEGGSQVNKTIHLLLLGIRATRSSVGKSWLETFAANTSGDLQLLTHKVIAARKGGRS